jgi:heme A synthase
MKTMSENEKTTVQAASASRMDMRREARIQLVFLSAQFLLGMAVNLIGQPSQTTGAARAVSTVLLGLHVVVAIGLVFGAVMVIRAARGGGDRPRQLARSGAVLIGLTVIAGVMTVITNNNWWSYTMAVGFIASVLLYGSLLVWAQSPPPQPEQPS